MMNHDATHCKDFCADCPISCYRSELEVDLRSRWAEFIGVPLSYAHLYGTEECKRDSYHKESIVEQKNDVVAEPTDLISRADAIALLTKIVFDEPPYLDSETLCRLYAEEQINALPSADRQSGEWVRKTDDLSYWYVCSQCGERPMCNRFSYKEERSDYCPNCGAKMGSDTR